MAGWKQRAKWDIFPWLLEGFFGGLWGSEGLGLIKYAQNMEKEYFENNVQNGRIKITVVEENRA